MVQYLISTSVLVLFFCGVVFAAPTQQTLRNNEVVPERFINEHPADGSYSYLYELTDGQIVGSRGALKTVDRPEGPIQVVVSVGQYSFMGPDGETYWVNWTADDKGFRPHVGMGTTGGILTNRFSEIDETALKSLIG